MPQRHGKQCLSFILSRSPNIDSQPILETSWSSLVYPTTAKHRKNILQVVLRRCKEGEIPHKRKPIDRHPHSKRQIHKLTCKQTMGTNRLSVRRDVKPLRDQHQLGRRPGNLNDGVNFLVQQYARATSEKNRIRWLHWRLRGVFRQEHAETGIHFIIF